MALQILRPDSDVTNNWAKSTGTEGFKCIDDAIESPTDGETAGDGTQITGTTTAGTTQECGFGTFSITGKTVKKTTLYVFCKTGSKRGIDISLRTAAGQIGATTSVGQSAAKGWRTVVFEGALTQEQIDDLRVRVATTTIEGGGGANSPTVYAAYIEVEHEAAGESKKWVQELADTQGTSDALSKKAAKALADTQGSADTAAKATAKALADTQGSTDAVSKAPAKALADTQGTTDGFTKKVSKLLTDAQELLDGLTSKVFEAPKEWLLELADSVGLVDALQKSVGKSTGDTQALADTVSKAPQKSLEDQQATQDAVTKGAGKSLSDTAPTEDSIVKGAVKSLADSINPVDGLSSLVGAFIEQLGHLPSRARFWRFLSRSRIRSTPPTRALVIAPDTRARLYVCESRARVIPATATRARISANVQSRARLWHSETRARIP